METGSTVRFVEEESQGWTILSTTEGEDLSSSIALIKKESCREETEDSDNDVENGKNGENHESGEDQKGGENQEVGESQEVGENQILGKENHVSDIKGGGLKNNKQPAFDDFVSAADDDDDDEKNNTNFHISPRSSHNKNLSWNFNRTEEGVLEGHMNNKNGGVFWRASLFASLGFLGWVFISNTFNGGGGKDLRCMKLHPCSIKGGGGDHVLNSS